MARLSIVTLLVAITSWAVVYVNANLSVEKQLELRNGNLVKLQEMFKVQVTRLQEKLNCVEALEHKVEEQSFISALQRCMDAKPYNKALPTRAKIAAIKPVTSKPVAKPVAASLIKSPAPKLTAKPAAKPEKEKEVFWVALAEPPVKPVVIKQSASAQNKPMVKQSTAKPTTRPTTRTDTEPSARTTRKPSTRTDMEPSARTTNDS